MLDLTKNHKILLFSINSLIYPKLAGGVGKIIIQDLKELTSLKPIKEKINIVLDEFNVFASETVINLINKSRAFNYQCFLSFQTINDLKTNNTNLTDTVFGNVNNIICHNIKDPNTAEYIASVFGTKETEKLTRQIDFKNSTSNMWDRCARLMNLLSTPMTLKLLKLANVILKPRSRGVNYLLKKLKFVSLIKY